MAPETMQFFNIDSKWLCCEKDTLTPVGRGNTPALAWEDYLDISDVSKISECPVYYYKRDNIWYCVDNLSMCQRPIAGSGPTPAAALQSYVEVCETKRVDQVTQVEARLAGLRQSVLDAQDELDYLSDTRHKEIRALYDKVEWTL